MDSKNEIEEIEEVNNDSDSVDSVYSVDSVDSDNSKGTQHSKIKKPNKKQAMQKIMSKEEYDILIKNVIEQTKKEYQSNLANVSNISDKTKGLAKLLTTENTGLNITTEGLLQDAHKNINLAKIKDLTQCTWCAKYYNGDIVIIDANGQVCKHCIFSVNHDINARLAFDTECVKNGTGIALYIVECKDAHNTNGCVRHPCCYLCDYKLRIPIKNILNPEMLDLNDNGVYLEQKILPTQTIQMESQEKVIFLGNNSTQKVKVPLKLTI